MSRSFTIVSVTSGNKKIKYEDGRFISEKPHQAAKKMFTKIHNTHKKVKSMVITLRETTRDSKKKEYKYKITKTPEKVEVERDGVVIVYNFVTKTKSMN